MPETYATDWFLVEVGNENDDEAKLVRGALFSGSVAVNGPRETAKGPSVTGYGFEGNIHGITLGLSSTREILITSSNAGVDPMPIRIFRMLWS